MPCCEHVSHVRLGISKAKPAGLSRWQECEQCQNVKLEREVETLSVALEPGMRDGQVRARTLTPNPNPTPNTPAVLLNSPP